MFEFLLWAAGLAAIILKIKLIAPIASLHWLIILSPTILAFVLRIAKLGLFGSGVESLIDSSIDLDIGDINFFD